MSEKEEVNKENEAGNKGNIAEDSLSDSPSSSRSASSSASSGNRVSDSKQKQQAELVGEGDDKKLVRYKYVEPFHIQCCKICKHPDKSKRACVCVVPLSQRRANLGTGCRNCGCTGCSKEDYLSKGQDPEYHPEDKDKIVKPKRPQEPKRQEKKPERPERPERIERLERRRERSNSRKKIKSPRRKVSKQSSSRSRSPEYIDSASMKFYNVDRSLIGGMIINEYQLNPILLGFGVPQRTYSYVFGKPK